jgi:hypothetical protein
MRPEGVEIKKKQDPRKGPQFTPAEVDPTAKSIPVKISSSLTTKIMCVTNTVKGSRITSEVIPRERRANKVHSWKTGGQLWNLHYTTKTCIEVSPDAVGTYRINNYHPVQYHKFKSDDKTTTRRRGERRKNKERISL